MKAIKAIFELLRETAVSWSHTKGSLLAAALAYYTIFSLAPLLLLSIGVSSLVYEEANVRSSLVSQIQGFVGRETAEFIGTIIENASQTTSGVAATVISAIVLLVTASAVFYQLKRALNSIWGIASPPRQGIVPLLKIALSSFGMALTLGLLLLLSIGINTLLGVVVNFVVERWSILHRLAEIVPALEFGIAFIMITALFAVVFRTLPDVKVGWRDVWLGAVVTALLFILGLYLIRFVLISNWINVGAAYGAASSPIVLMFWIYLSAQIFLFGAQLTRVYANKYGSEVVPAHNATIITFQQYERPVFRPRPSQEAEPPAPEPPAAEPPERQLERQVGVALLGLAAGFLLAFLTRRGQ